MQIKFAVKGMACLTLAALCSSLSAQQSAPTPTSDSTSQSQTQTQSQSASQSESETSSQTQPASTQASQPKDQNSAPPSQSQTSQSEASQNQTSPSQTSQSQTSPDQNAQENKDKTTGKVAGTSNDRLFYTLPNFLTVQNQKLPPLSVKDKFKVVALGNFDFIQYPWWALVAAVAQADNSEPQFRQGWLAYAKRYGTTAGDSSVENFMVGAVFPSVLRLDPRFYYSENGGIPHRVGYAISRVFLTRTDSGRTTFNYAEIFGAATAAAISDYTYHPRSTVVNGEFIPSDRTLSNTAIVFGTQIGLDTITFVVKEFWPDIHRKMAHKHAMQQSAGSDSSSKQTP